MFRLFDISIFVFFTCSFSNSDDVVLGSEKEITLRNCGAGHANFSHAVFGKKFVFLARLDHENISHFRRKLNFAIGCDG